METGPSSSTSSSSSSCASTASHSASASASASLSKSSTSINSTTAAAALACPDDRPITSLDKRLYLAIDCGGTKAAAVISDQDGHVVGRGFGGPANFTDVGLDAFLLSVQEAIHQALGCCKNLHSTSPTTLPPGVARRAEPLFEAAWLGIAGVDSEVDVQQLTPYLATLLSLPYPSNRLMVANDTSLLAAPVRDTAHPDIRSGVVVIAGTGSIVMSFKADDGGLLQTLGRVGGFGWLLGDEGSGYWVGRDALRFILDQADRDRLGGSSMFADDTFGSSSSSSASASKLDVTRAKEQDHLLRDRILDLWNLTSVDELLNAVYSNRNPGQPRTPAMRSGQSSPPEEADPAPRLDDLYIPDGPLQQTMSGSGPTAASSSSDRDGDRLVRLMPPAAAPATHLGPTSPIPSLSPYGSVASLSVASASSSTDTLESGVAELMLASASSLGRERFAGEDDEMRLYSEPGHERAESVTSARSAAEQADAAPPPAAGAMLQERKHRLASLAPLVFHLALQHGDPNSLAILRGQARRLASQIASVFPRERSSAAYIDPPKSVLCMGGSLLGVEGYQRMLEDELSCMGVGFGRTVFVSDPARSGAVTLAKMWEARMQTADGVDGQ